MGRGRQGRWVRMRRRFGACQAEGVPVRRAEGMHAHARQARTAVQRRRGEEVYKCTGVRAQGTRACGPTCCRSCSVFSRCESVSVATSSARSASARSVLAVSALRAAWAQGGERRDGDEEDVVRTERPEVHGVRLLAHLLHILLRLLCRRRRLLGLFCQPVLLTEQLAKIVLGGFLLLLLSVASDRASA